MLKSSSDNRTIKETGFTGPSVFLSVNVRGPVYFAVSVLQCHWHCQPCSYGRSSVTDIINPAVMEAPVSLTQSTLQLWTLQCHWYCQSCSYGSSSVIDTVNPAVMDAPVSLILSTLHLCMLQCHWHWSMHIYRIDSSIFPLVQHYIDICTSEAHSMHARHWSHTKVCCKSIIWILHAKYKVSCKNDDFKYHSVIIWIYYTQSIQG